MASKESGCEGGDVKLWPPVQKKKNGTRRLTYSVLVAK